MGLDCGGGGEMFMGYHSVVVVLIGVGFLFIGVLCWSLLV